MHLAERFTKENREAQVTNSLIVCSCHCTFPANISVLEIDYIECHTRVLWAKGVMGVGGGGGGFFEDVLCLF